MPLRHASTRVLEVITAALVATLAVLLPGGAVLAHTEFESSDPADGAVVDTPVDRIVITYTSAAEPAGDGFVVLDPGGSLRTPNEVVDLDDRSFELRFDPPLAGGEVGVRWQVRAGDSHPIDGAFSFTVTAPAPTVAPPPTAAPTTAPAEPGSTPAASTPADSDSSGTTGDDGAVATTTEPVETAVASADDTGGTAPLTLDEFLAQSSDDGSDALGRVGRTITLLAVALALGVFAFTATALRGSRTEVAAAIVAVQIAGAAVALGAVVEFAGLLSSTGDAAADAITTSAGVATLLRFVGGAALAIGLLSARGSLVSTSPRALSAAVVDDRVDTAHGAGAAPTFRWAVDRRAGLALAGAATIVVSFWFDGHTVTEGWRPLHAAVDSVHVVAGSVWVGGVAAMAALLWARRRGDRPSGAADLVLRFSPVATVSLIGVALAGAVMAAIVLDSPGELFSTEWGQVLLLKTAAVAVAAAIGAYNHLVLRPALDAAPDDRGVADRARTSVTAEAIVLLFVVVVTASLVAASTI